jgi:hypothetical protein|tara:strand:+ start:658 stop:1143 length:486 start_codon:yes stop_codon:yes gene_type:complete
MKKMKKKGMAKGGAMMKKKGYAAGGKLPMKKDPKTGAMVPAYAMDGKGKMNKGGKVKKKAMAKGGAMKKKGYAMGGVTSYGTANPTPMGMQQPQMPMDPKKPSMAKGGNMKKKTMAKGGAMKKKGYAMGGKVMTYNMGGMVKSTGTLNTGIKKASPTGYNS